jgi:hypothetical protein
MSGGLQVALQSAVDNDLSFVPLSFGQDSGAAPAIDVCGGEIVDALVISAVVVVVDESGNLSFEIARQKVIFQHDAVLEGLMPAPDFALGLTGSDAGQYIYIIKKTKIHNHHNPQFWEATFSA